MRVGKILSIVVVSVASLIVLAAGVFLVVAFAPFRSHHDQQNFAPSEGQQAISPSGNIILVSQSSGSSSFLYRKDVSTGASVRFTSASSGIESEASFSHNGKLIVYAFASSPDSRSTVWVIGADGRNARALTGDEQDALHPVFSPDDLIVFYASSSFTGHYSPVVRPARHDWDVFSVPVQSDAAKSRVSPTQVTHESLYDLHSLDAVADGISPGGIKVLISTTGYPIGALIREFDLRPGGRQSIFQPHVSGEPSQDPAFGEARFVHGGMDILFLAATDPSGGTYDYNVYSMSDVTGGDLKQLTHLKGMTKELKVLADGRATFVNSGLVQVLDIDRQTVKPL